MVRRRGFRVLALLAGLALVIAACTDGGLETAEQGSNPTVAPPDTVLRIGVEQWPACLNPLTCAGEALHDTVLQHVLPRAMELGPDGDYRASRLLDGAPQPSSRTDGTVEIAYRIAEEARWADGRPITSTDFVATWRAIMDTPAADRTGYTRIVSIDDVDPTEAVVVLAGPVVDWQELFGGATGVLLRADALGEGTDLTGRFVDELPMAAGPYQLLGWDGERAVLGATDPWGEEEPPEVDQVRLERIDLESLEDPMVYDMLVPASGSTAPVPDAFEAVTTPSDRILGVWFDQRSPYLAALGNRRVVDTLLDRSALVDAVGGVAVECAGWAPGIGPWCAAAAIERPEPDPELARFVLATQGWTLDGAGNLVAGETVLSIPLSYDPDVFGSEALADEVEAALDQVGIGVTRRETPTDTWWEPRPLDRDTGLGIFAFDAGVSPRVDDLYGCPVGASSSVVAACPPALVDAARGLGTMSAGDALDTVVLIGDLVAEQVLWVPVVALRTRGFVREGRVVVPETTSPVGGPLAGLAAFQADV